MLRLAAALGQRTLAALDLAARIAALPLLALHAFLAGGRRGGRVILWVFLRQVQFTGVQAVPLAVLLALFVGFITIVQALARLGETTIADPLVQILVSAIVREGGPLITAFVIIARSATAAAAELGGMRAGGEVAALEALGIDPRRYLVFPRLAGFAVAAAGLTLIFDAAAVLGGWAIAAAVFPVPLLSFLERLGAALGPADLAVTAGKSAAFGLLIAAAACACGLEVGRSRRDIPKAATKAVVASLALVVLADGIITFLLYF